MIEEVGRWGGGELTGPHSLGGVGIRGNGEMGRWGVIILSILSSLSPKSSPKSSLLSPLSPCPRSPTSGIFWKGENWLSDDEAGRKSKSSNALYNFSDRSESKGNEGRRYRCL
ncbi:hypothetical protein CEN44_16865 [Fischerella muscicola CCMEE 5323]|uniref:Uncharacterized protein n=1 Tax=Fischerella muscicola CCMEE 5323 TaxID=2019572 RepID=A0A2N6K0N9_FISMU|nr:hypothetical protein CEN44_16865 [Fischerella muscicola CCMEE 5323]